LAFRLKYLKISAEEHHSSSSSEPLYHTVPPLSKMEVLTIDDIPTATALYELERLSHPAGHKPLHAPSAAFNKRISLVKYDITRLQIDAIVNAANESLLGGGGVDGAIHRAAGPRLFDECSLLDGCETGNAKITNGFKLPSRKIIHAVGPVYSMERRRGNQSGEGPGRSERLLRSCYRQSLDLCDQNGLETVAFSCLSTGVYGYPSSEAAQAALSEVRTYFEEGKGPNIKNVVFCVFLPKDNEAYLKHMP
jgi:O-acetyl-ADP-ribose deacetylase